MDSSKIISEEYADLIVEYNKYSVDNNENLLIVNSKHAILNVPVGEIGLCNLGNYRYHEFPNCFSLLSVTSLEKSGVTQLLNIPSVSSGGQGVLVAIIDTGVDYRHPAFCYEDGTSRIVSLWDQTIQTPGMAPVALGFGTEYSKEILNTALASEDPLQIVPSVDEIGHGTMIAGIAAGRTDLNNNFMGVVPNAELVVVKLKQAKQILRNIFVVPDGAVCYQESDILLAIRYVTDIARMVRRPLSICIAIGTNQGGHDGRGSVSSYLSQVNSSTGMVAVIAAGNEANTRRHYYGTLNPKQEFDEFELNIGRDEFGFTMEIWEGTPNRLAVDMITPSGEYIPQILPSINECREISLVFAPTIIQVNNYLLETETGSQAIIIRLRNPLEGIWKFRVYNLERMKSDFHVWLPIGGLLSENTYFTRSNSETTITSPGNAMLPITIGSYNHENDSIYLNSSRGYTRTEIIKPDLVAPGVNLTCPIPNNGYGKATGTGAAAAHAAGIAAIGLEWGIVKGNNTYINGVEIKKLLIRGAERGNSLLYPNKTWGYGIINVLGAFRSLP